MRVLARFFERLRNFAVNQHLLFQKVSLFKKVIHP